MYGNPVTPAKRRIDSRTHRFNVAMAVLGTVEAKFVLLQPLLPVDVYQLLLFVVIVGNAVLRELTTQPIGGAE